MTNELLQLKAKAFDLLAALQTLEIELQKVNKQIIELQQQENADGNNSNNRS